MCKLPKLRSMFAMRACRSAVMIGTALDQPKMTSLVRQAATLEQPWNCPHGRPTLRHLVDLTLARSRRPRPPSLRGADDAAATATSRGRRISSSPLALPNPYGPKRAQKFYSVCQREILCRRRASTTRTRCADNRHHCTAMRYYTQTTCYRLFRSLAIAFSCATRATSAIGFCCMVRLTLGAPSPERDQVEEPLHRSFGGRGRAAWGVPAARRRASERIDAQASSYDQREAPGGGLLLQPRANPSCRVADDPLTMTRGYEEPTRERSKIGRAAASPYQARQF